MLDVPTQMRGGHRNVPMENKINHIEIIRQPHEPSIARVLASSDEITLIRHALRYLNGPPGWLQMIHFRLICGNGKPHMLRPHEVMQNRRIDIQFWQDMEQSAVNIRRLDKMTMRINEPGPVVCFGNCMFHPGSPVAMFCGVLLAPETL